MKSMLQVHNLTVEFIKERKKYAALKEVTFHINEGEVVGMVGESGCGKSITSLAIMGILPENFTASKGSILINGQEVVGLSAEELSDMRGKEVSMIFQEPMTALNPLLPVGEQIQEAFMIHSKASKREAYEKTLNMMELVGLSRAKELYKEYPHQLSGGMRQRIMIAMAIINNPSILIADEPTTALDVTIQAQILDIIKKLNKKQGAAVLFVSHDLGVVRELCSRVVIMYAGSVVEEGNTHDIFLKPLHPYTKGLLSSIPTMDKKGEELYSIKGVVPALVNRNSKGCSFANRCAEAEEKCFSSVPEIKYNSSRGVRCFKVQEGITQ